MSTPKSIGRYEIIEELGHGAMGTVYRAKDPAMDRVVALKTIIAVALSSQQGTEFRERFYREARAAGKLAHPGIVPVFDVGEHEGLPFLVMEFIDGRTLDDAAKSGERLTLERVCEIGQQIAEALGYAHRNGVVHRDIKPANILLTSVAKYGIERPKITDFGVAKLAAGSTTMSGQMLGTPAFMPPEQFTGAAVDGRADIFSLGGAAVPGRVAHRGFLQSGAYRAGSSFEAESFGAACAGGGYPEMPGKSSRGEIPDWRRAGAGAG